MESTTYKQETKQYNSNVVIQVTKRHLQVFFSIVFLIAVMLINFFAITSNSPLLTELIIVQGIIALIAFIKFSKSNTISRK